MPDDHLLKLINFLARWGVQAICFGGGGEPTLHSRLADAIQLTVSLNMEASVATNGISWDDSLLDALSLCRWVGISMDAATPQTYVIGRNKNLFHKAIDNMTALVRLVQKKKSGCDVAFKFLIFDYNQHEIYEACKLAKTLGVQDFHARPADFSHQGMGRKKNRQITTSI